MLALNHLWEWIFNLFFATPKTKILKPTGSVTPMEVYLLPGPTLLLNPQHLSSTPPILALWVLANTFTNFTISSTTLITTSTPTLWLVVLPLIPASHLPPSVMLQPASTTVMALTPHLLHHCSTKTSSASVNHINHGHHFHCIH